MYYDVVWDVSAKNSNVLLETDPVTALVFVIVISVTYEQCWAARYCNIIAFHKNY